MVPRLYSCSKRVHKSFASWNLVYEKKAVSRQHTQKTVTILGHQKQLLTFTATFYLKEFISGNGKKLMVLLRNRAGGHLHSVLERTSTTQDSP